MKENGTLKRSPGRYEQLMEWIDGEPKPGFTSDQIRLAHGMDWFVDQLGKFASGTNFLLSGDPGVGKSTLALQLAGAAATAGEKILYIATEQSADAVRERFVQLCPATRAQKYLTIKDDLYDLTLLPQLLTNQLLRKGSDLYGTRFVIIDSLQGCGISDALDKKLWSSILDYLRQSAGAGIANLALAHQTKGREIAGPKALEHSCDVTLLLRHAVSCRTLSIPKNRIGASVTEPFALDIDPNTTRLEPSRLGAATIASVQTIAHCGIVDIQVAITPVRHGRGFVKAPGMSIKEVETVVDLVERIYPEARYIGSLGVTVRGPDGVRHRRDWNLAIAAALVGALRRFSMKSKLVFIGDISLEGHVHPPSAQSMQCLEDAKAAGILEQDLQLVISSNSDKQNFEEFGCTVKQFPALKDAVTFMESFDE